MSYASVADMIARFGAPEMIRLSRPEDRTAETPDAAKIEVALADGASLINDYLRKLYRVPLETVPASVTRAACILARYDLAQGERSNPTEEMRLARKEIIGWLEGIATGAVQLDAPGLAGPVAGPGGTGPRVSDRSRPFSDDNLSGW